MKTTRFVLMTALAIFQHSLCSAAEPGFKDLFNGKDLSNWDGDPKHWSVKDGVINGETTPETPLKGNTFLIYRGGEVSNFELRFKYRIVPHNNQGFGNSGVQYRSKDFGNWVVGGYQGDFEAGTTYSGILYEERMRGILAQRGQKTTIKADPNDASKTKVEVTGKMAMTSEQLQAAIHKEEWNDYVIIADGNHLQHFINGNQTIDVLDEQPGKAAKSGILALQLHAGPPMQVQFKDIRIKELGKHASAGDLEKFQGTWKGFKGAMNGNPISDDDIQAAVTTYTGNKYKAVWNGGDDEGTITLNESASPKTMDLKTAGGNTVLAIYRFTDEGLEVCFGFDGAGRPAKFEAPQDSKFLVASYKKKAD